MWTQILSGPRTATIFLLLGKARSSDWSESTLEWPGSAWHLPIALQADAIMALHLGEPSELNRWLEMQ
jgi:hypothetical protein